MNSGRDDQNAAISNTNNARNIPSNFIQSPPHINQYSTINHQLFNQPFVTSPYPVNTNMLITQPQISHQVHHMTSVHTQHVINSTPIIHNHTLPPTSPYTYPIPTTYPSPIHSIPIHVPPSTPYHHVTTSHSPHQSITLPPHQSLY